jgi:hypothetical protein
MAASDKTLTLYDIILDPRAYPGSPNPWKVRCVNEIISEFSQDID